ncbi:MAG: FeoA domain-containing protein [Nanoarchaeota archaeon]|nr:FeoA domain-containing protein [Nanoarchaeota archaeon]
MKIKEFSLKKIVDLVEGEEGVVESCENYRFLEQGFIPGTYIKMYKKLSGVISVCIRGTIIAARNKDYEKIFIKSSK